MADPFLHTIPAWRWALTQTRRDLRATSMRVLLVAVTLAVAALTAVAFFADRIERGLSRDAAQLLGGDVVVVGDQPLPDDFARRAQADQLRTARTASSLTSSSLIRRAASSSRTTLRASTGVSESPNAMIATICFLAWI